MMIWLHFFCSFWMMVTIIFVQLVHYPLFLALHYSDRVAYAKKHQAKISFIVMPVMLLELVSLIAMASSYALDIFWLTLCFLLVVIWTSTFLIQVPCHKKMLLQPDDKILNRLVQSNWIRTIAWTLKTVCILYMILQQELIRIVF